MRYFVTVDGQEHSVEVTLRPGGGHDVKIVTDPERPNDMTALDCELLADTGVLTVRVGGHVLDLVLDGEAPNLNVVASGRRAPVQVESARMRAAASMRGRGKGGGDGVVTSPMPGKVVKVLVAEGEEVSPGKPLIVVEAMKMENELVAEAAGTVQKVFVKPGDAVEGGAKLIMIG